MVLSRRTAASVALLCAMALHVPAASAQAAPAFNCPPGQSVTLDPRFASFALQIGGALGQPTDCAAWSDDGTGNQPTTTGLLGVSADGSLIFIDETTQDIYSLDASGFSYLPGSPDAAQDAPSAASADQAANPAPAAPANVAPAEPPAVQPAPAPAPAASAGGVMPGKYNCYALGGGSMSTQVARTGNAVSTKQINGDGTWRDTTYGSMTANNPKYAGTWAWDGSVLSLVWGSGSVNKYHLQSSSFGPALAEFDEATANEICYPAT